MIKKLDQYPPIRGLILANSGQGKTYWLSDYIRGLLGKQWSSKRVIIISKTFKSDSSIAPLIEDCKTKKKNFLEQNCFDDVDAGVKFMTDLVSAQKHVKEDLKKPIPQWCVVLDDLISEGLLYDKKFIQLLALGRHYGVSIFTLLQETRALSPKALGNCNLLVVGRLANQDRLEGLLQGFNEGLGNTKKERRENVLRLYTTAISKKERAFLIIRPHEFQTRNRYLDVDWQPLID